MPCCIDRMRFSPRFSIRKREKKDFFLSLLSSFFFLLPSWGPVWSRRRCAGAGPVVRAGLHCYRCWVAGGGGATAGGTSGGSSAVEQRTVKRALGRSDPLVGSSNLPLRIFVVRLFWLRSLFLFARMYRARRWGRHTIISR